MVFVVIQDGDADANAIVLYSCRMAMVRVMFQGGDADTMQQCG